MEVFFLKANLFCPLGFQYRISPLHGVVFHGVVEADSLVQTSEISLSGEVNTTVVGELVISRSGEVIPSVFMPASTHMILSQAIAEKVQRVGRIVASPVSFGKLVRIGMPPVGDFSWYSSFADLPGLEPMEAITSLADCPEFHLSAPAFYRLACPVVFRLRHVLPDARRVEANFGSYNCGVRCKVLVSKSLLETCPVCWDDVFVMRREVFEVVAPCLDLDHFLIAYAQI